jgi:3-carboxy-cis,cis-muconate cycloisomerase
MDLAKLKDQLWLDSPAAEVLSFAAVVDALVAVESALTLALADVDLVEFETAIAICEKYSAAADELKSLGFSGTPGQQGSQGLLAHLVAKLNAVAVESSDEAGALISNAAGSQDIADSTLMLLAKSALIETHQQLIGAVLSIMQFVHAYRKSPALQRNNDDTAAASTFGLKLASWLDGIVQATAQLTAVIDSLPSQLGGKAGNLAELTAITKNSGEAVQVANAFADRLELAPCAPWHANRAPILAITAVSSALASAFANIAHDVITLADPSIAELGEVVLDAEGNVIVGAEDGNIRTRLAAASSLLMTTSQAAAIMTAAPRSVESYNTQWLATLDTLRLTLATASLGNSLIASLDVHADAMGLNLIAAGFEATDVHAAEQIIDAILAGING